MDALLPVIKAPATGTPVEMTMNYMDYTDDACMYMFSAWSKNKNAGCIRIGWSTQQFCSALMINNNKKAAQRAAFLF